MSSRFRCPRCSTVNMFNPSLGGVVRCGTCAQISQLQQPSTQNVLVSCPGCHLRMTMQPNSTTARCPRCAMVFTTVPPGPGGPPQMVQGQVASSSPTMGAVVQEGSPSGGAAATSAGEYQSKAQPPMPDQQPHHVGHARRSTPPPPAMAPPSHFDLSMPMPQVQQEEEELEWDVANETFHSAHPDEKKHP